MNCVYLGVGNKQKKRTTLNKIGYDKIIHQLFP